MSTGYSRYDGVADWYEATFNEFNGEEADFLAEALGAGHGQKCLDVACGTGRRGEAITGAGYVPVGIDISTDQLRFAKQRLHAVCADAQQFPFAGGVVGVVVGMYFPHRRSGLLRYCSRGRTRPTKRRDLHLRRSPPVLYRTICRPGRRNPKTAHSRSAADTVVLAGRGVAQGLEKDSGVVLEDITKRWRSSLEPSLKRRSISVPSESSLVAVRYYHGI